jgi:hypothetical protein
MKNTFDEASHPLSALELTQQQQTHKGAQNETHNSAGISGFRFVCIID